MRRVFDHILLPHVIPDCLLDMTIIRRYWCKLIVRCRGRTEIERHMHMAGFCLPGWAT